MKKAILSLCFIALLAGTAQNTSLPSAPPTSPAPTPSVAAMSPRVEPLPAEVEELPQGADATPHTPQFTAEPAPTAGSFEMEHPSTVSDKLPKQSTTSPEPKMGDTRTIDGQKQVYFLGFGWIEDNDEPNVGITVDGDGDINKMVGSMSGVTYAEDMYENGNKIGIMGSEDGSGCEPPVEAPYTPQQGDVMIDFQTGEVTAYSE